MTIVTYKCPVSDTEIDIRYNLDNAHIEDIRLDEQNIKSFFELFRNIVDISKEKGIQTFTQVVSVDDWNDSLRKINEWDIVCTLHDANLIILRCKIDDILTCIGKGFGIGPSHA